MAGKWEKAIAKGDHWPMELKEERRQRLVHCESVLRDKFMTKNDESYTIAEQAQLQVARQTAIEDVTKAINALE